MKVWVIGRGYPEKNNSMLGSFELEQAKMLARIGMDVTYFVIDIRSIRRLRKFGYYRKNEDNVKVEFCSIPIGPVLPKNKRGIVYYCFMERLMAKTALKDGNPDIIHVHYPSLVPYRVVKKWQELGTKVVATEHWTKVQNKTLAPMHVNNLTDFTNESDAMCCVGSNLKNSIIDLTGTEKEIYIIPNVVSNIFNAKKETHTGFRFLCSGRLVPVKQFDIIVNAFLDVFQGNSDVSLTIAGNGEDYSKINSIIQSRKAIDQVQMLGEVSRGKMAELFAACDALVVFSKLETFCVPVIEAWACGKPVTTTTTTTVFADNPDRRLGIMVDWQNPDSLKEALQYLYDHYSEYDSDWIREYASLHFSEKAVSKQLVDIYQQIAGSNT